MPQKLAGVRIEQTPSLPVAIGAIPAATATALPPLDPPGVRSVFHGLRQGGPRRLSVAPFQPNSGVFVLPTMIAPASYSRSTIG